MFDSTPIRSNTNREVKRVRAALRGKQPGLLALEGERLVQDALASGLRPELILCDEAHLALAEAWHAAGLDARLASDSVLASLSELSSAPGVLALVPQPEERAFDASLLDAADPLLVVVAGIADPGNLGALARTAEAAGAAGMLVVQGGCKPWNPKALRGSMGSLLRLPLFEMRDCAAAWDALCAAGFVHVLANTRGGLEPRVLDWGGKLALWLTSETGEWPAELRERSSAPDARCVTIPLAPGVESLNVTSAASVLLFAAGRTGTGERG